MKVFNKKVALFLVLAILAVTVIGCGAKEEPKEEVVKEVISEDLTTDVVVIGAGGAGLAAALEVKENGKDVIVVEKMGIAGGNTLRATGGINAAETSVQKDLGIEDSVELHYEDTIKGGHEKNDEELVKTMTENAADSIEWLLGKGADLSDIGRLGGASADRAHRPSGGSAVGPHLVDVLKENIEKEGITVLTKTTATEILFEDEVKGIKVENKDGEEFTINANSVIVATGGFGANIDMVVEYKPELEGFGTTNHDGATGEGIKLAQAIGADVTQMEEIQIHPTVVKGTGIMITEAVRGNGALLVNKNGERFINEVDTRDVVSKAVLEQEGGSAYLLFGNEIKEGLKAIENYIKQGLTTEGETLEELAKELDMDAEKLQETVAHYNELVDGGEDTDFNRPDMPSKIEEGNFYAIEISPAVHHTMGGLKINTNAEVLNEAGEVIKGLYAAGEVTGGVHGGNRLGGNALTDIITFGKIAGKAASER